MTGFEPRNSGIGRDRSTNWATTAATVFMILIGQIFVVVKDQIMKNDLALWSHWIHIVFNFCITLSALGMLLDESSSNSSRF